MPMNPEEKAKRIARQEAEWAKQRGEVPQFTSGPLVTEATVTVTADEAPWPQPEPEMQIDAHSSGAKFDEPEPKTTPRRHTAKPVVSHTQAVKKMKAEAKSKKPAGTVKKAAGTPQPRAGKK